jgi:hypothetical protein
MRRKVTIPERPAWVAGNLPLEIISAPQTPGRVRDLDTTLAELFEERK